jgi:hypothetical protein
MLSVPVYNLEVEEAHAYYAEGVLVHNCDDCAALHGQVWTEPSEHPYPGDSPFGGAQRCGPNCRCALVYDLVPATDAPPPDGSSADATDASTPPMSMQEYLDSLGVQMGSTIDLSVLSVPELLALHKVFDPSQPRDERGQWTSADAGTPAVWPDAQGADGRGSHPLPESVQPHIAESATSTMDELQAQQEVWKDTVANQIADRMNTPAGLAALAASPGLGGPGSLMSSGGVFVAGGDPMAPGATMGIEAQWPNMTPEERIAAMQDNPNVRYAIAAGFVHSWANTSSDADPQALALQMAAGKEFGLDATVQNSRGVYGPGRPDPQGMNPSDNAQALSLLDQNGTGLRAMLRATYDNTQAAFAAAGITEVTVTRGVYQAPPEVPRVDNPIIHQPTPDFGPDRMWQGTVQSNPLSSWTTDRSVARGFGDYHLTTTVPVSRVFSTAATGFGCALESEVVLLGGPTNVVADRKWS